MNQRSRTSTKRRNFLGSKRTSIRRLQFEKLELRHLMAVNVAVVFDQLGNTGGYTAIRDQLANDTFADFNASLVQASTLTTASALSSYDVIVIGGDGNDNALSNTSFASTLSGWVNSGGGVVMTGFGTFGSTATSSFRSILDGIIPIQFSAAWGFSGASSFSPISQAGSFTPATHEITNNVGAFSIGNGSAPTEWSQSTTISSVLDSGASLLGTLNGRLTGAAATKGTGRSVWLGPAYAANSSGWGSFTGSLRSGNADRLLEQAVLWAGSAPASILDVVDVSPDPRNSPVDTVDVTFSRPINATTFSGSDITLTRNGGANLIDSGVSVSLLSGNTYRISNLASLTASSGTYNITVNGAGITDTNGNAVSGSVTDSWVVDLTPPTVATSSFVASGALSSSATSMTVTFDEGINGAANAANYQLRRAGVDGLLGTVDDPIVTISSASLSGNTATLNFAALTEDVYRLTVKQTITDLVGNILDGDGNSTAGGDWRKDFVVGALTTALTSPNGFVFDPEFGGFGAGQLVQGTGNAFDGYGRLAVGASSYISSHLSAPSVDVYEKQGVADGTDNGILTSLTQTFTSDGSPVRLQASVTARARGASGGSTYRMRFVIDGVEQSAYASAHVFPSDSDLHIPINLEDWITGLSPGVHTVQVKVSPIPGFNTADLYFGYDDSSFVRITEFNQIPGVGPSVDVYEKQGVADGTDNGILTSLTQTFTSDGSPVRLQSSVTARARGASGGSTYRMRFVIDGVEQSAYASAHVFPSDSDLHIPINLEDWITGLSPGVHTVQVKVSPIPGFNTADLYFGYDDSSFVRITEFNQIPGVGPSVDVYEKQGVADGTDNGILTSLTQTFTSDGSPVRLQSSVTARARGASGGSTYRMRFVIDGVEQSAYASAHVFPSDSDLHIPINLEDWITGLSPGVHTVQVKVSPIPGFNTADLYFGYDDSAFVRITEFNQIPQPVLADANSTVQTSTRSISSLSLSREVTVPATGSKDFARTVDVFMNPTVSTISMPIRLVGNLGSDAATTVFATSDGDLLVEPTDLWFGTDDADGTGTPAIIHLLHGPYGLQPTSVNVIEDNVEWTYGLTVPAGATMRLAYFTVLGTTRVDAIAAANALVTATGFGEQAAAFLTPQELASLANFQFNTAPTDLALTGNSVLENQPVGTNVGNLSTTDANAGDTFTYYLVAGSGDTDNLQFSIVGNSLITAAAFDFDTKSTYLIRIRTTDSGGLTFEKAFTINVTNVNEAPILTRSQATVAGNVLSTLTNSGTWSDPDADTVTLTASLGTVVKNANGTWDWSHTPTTQLLNQAVTVTANDGANTTSVSFTIDANVAVVLRGLAYNGATGTSASTSLATDKVPLLPGQSSTFANYTNYARGLNAIVFDVAGLPSSTTNAEMLASLQFAQWNGIAAAGFTSLSSAAIPSVTILTGAGTGGSTRVRVTFPDNTIQNTWLCITVLANAQTGLAVNDVFYFGNVIGELDFGNTATRLRVNGQDAALILANQSPGANSASVTNKFDLDRNGRVNGQDYAILLANQQAAGIVAPITAPSSRLGQRTLNFGEGEAIAGYWSVPSAVQNSRTTMIVSPKLKPLSNESRLASESEDAIRKTLDSGTRVAGRTIQPFTSYGEPSVKKKRSEIDVLANQVDRYFENLELELDDVHVG